MSDSNYITSLKTYREALQHALEIADDPFKAPEQVVATMPSVIAAAWNAQVEYAAMLRSR